MKMKVESAVNDHLIFSFKNNNYLLAIVRYFFQHRFDQRLSHDWKGIIGFILEFVFGQTPN